MKTLKIKSYCKINLSLRVLKKLKNGYHNIKSLITFCALYDLITISKAKDQNDKIIFSGKFKKRINKKSNTIISALNLLRIHKVIKNQFFKINIKKNIPHGSGLGGGSANAAAILNFFNNRSKQKLKKNEIKKIANQIGFDVPICLEKKNTLVTGKKNEILRLRKKFQFNLLIVYPNLTCSTKTIYNKSKKLSILKTKFDFETKNKKKIIFFLKNEQNDLEDAVFLTHPKIKKIINYVKLQKGCYFARITGTGSACIGIFSTIKNAIYAKNLIRSKYPKYWCAVSKTI